MEQKIDKEPRNYNQETPLHYAALQGQADIVEYLLYNVKDKNPVDRFHKTPLDRAKQGGHQNIVDLIENFKPTLPPTDSPHLTSWQPNYQAYIG